MSRVLKLIKNRNWLREGMLVVLTVAFILSWTPAIRIAVSFTPYQLPMMLSVMVIQAVLSVAAVILITKKDHP